MNRAGSVAGPRSGATVLRAVARIAISVLWLTTALSEGAMAADSVTPIGYFDTRTSDYAACGYSVELWRTAETVVGVLHDCEGPESNFGGMIEQVSYDQNTGHLAFTARLSIGDLVLGVGPDKQINQVPSRDVFTFDGRLATTDVTGTLKHVNEAARNPQSGATREQIILKRRKPPLAPSSYPSVADWHREMDEIYGRSR
jgi:hypothetical protein